MVQEQHSDEEHELERLCNVLRFYDFDCSKKHSAVQGAIKPGRQAGCWLRQCYDFEQWVSTDSHTLSGLFLVMGQRNTSVLVCFLVNSHGILYGSGRRKDRVIV